MKNEKWKKSSQLPIFKRCLTLLTILIVRTSKQRFCSLFPALAKRRPFRRERIEKSDGTFDFARNGFQHTLVGWFRITEDFMKGKKDTKSKSKTYYLFRFKCYPNLNENVDPVYKHLMKMSYTHFKKGGDSRVDFYIANGKKKLKKIKLSIKLKHNEWCYFAIAHNSKTGKGEVHLMSSSMESSKKFTTRYKYELRQVFKIYYGSFSNSTSDLKNGLYGDIGPMFYSSDKLEHIKHYWKTNYYEAPLTLSNYILLEYVFENYKDKKTIQDRLKKLPGKISGEAFYTGKTGITLSKGAMIKIQGNLSPKGDDVVKTLCFFSAIRYTEPLSKDFTLFKRGEPKKKKKNSFAIILRKKGKQRVPVLKVIYGDTKKKKHPAKTVEYVFSGAKLDPKKLAEIQFCLSQGPAFIASASGYANGKVKLFENKFGLEFDWKVGGDHNFILDETEQHKGRLVVDLFTVIEGGGNAVYRAETSQKLKKKCFSKCELHNSIMFMSYNCLVCKKKRNNVNRIPKKKCLRFCPLLYKNLDNYCLKCSKPHCADTRTPKMNIKKLDKHNQHFKISPNVKLQRHFNDWDKRIKCNVHGLQKGKDYKINLQIKKNNTIFLDFKGKTNFKKKNLSIEISNVKGIYDLDGNMMHVNKAQFYIKNFIVYDEKTKKAMGVMGAAIGGAFMCLGAIGVVFSFIGSSLNVGSALGMLMDMFEILQYLTFLMFLNTEIPPAPADFISSLFQNSIELGALLDQVIISLNIKDFNFSFNYDLSTPPKFQEEDIKYLLVLNAAIPFLMQVLTIFFWILFRIGKSLTRFNRSMCIHQWFRKKVDDMEFSGALAMFFMFDVEMVIFSALNIWQPETAHWILAISFTVSMIYLGMMILSIPLVFMLANKPKELLEDEVYKSDFEVIYEGYKLDDGISKYFRAFSIMRFLFFGLVLVFMYYIPLVQITGSFLIALTYLILLVVVQPHEERWDFYVELITEILFTLGNVCFLIFGLDDNFGWLSLKTRTNIGWFLFVVYVIALVTSILVAMIEMFELIKSIFEKCRGGKEEDEVGSKDPKEDKMESKKVFSESVNPEPLHSDRINLNTSNNQLDQESDSEKERREKEEKERKEQEEKKKKEEEEERVRKEKEEEEKKKQKEKEEEEKRKKEEEERKRKEAEEKERQKENEIRRRLKQQQEEERKAKEEKRLEEELRKAEEAERRRQEEAQRNDPRQRTSQKKGTNLNHFVKEADSEGSV